jgi:two-component system, chemotaxis family, protein-glutamate methylesterase/glutaminase
MAMSTSEPRAPRRVLIADDSELMRALLREHIRTIGGFEIVGEAATGYEVIRLVHELEPDILTLDLAMPELPGEAALDYIMKQAPRPVVIVSAQDERLAEAALAAMEHGAVEFVAKPQGTSDGERVAFRARLNSALRAAAVAHLLSMPRRRRERERRATQPEMPHDAARCAVAIAASTGGPRALTEIIPRLPPDLPAAVFIVQHMPPVFTAAFARRLNQISELPVHEARAGEAVQQGVVYVAPGGVHLDLVRDAKAVRIVLTDAAPVWNVRPAADVLFRAVARTYGPASVGIVLTGMGRDGAEGLRAISAVGGGTLAQDQATSVIGSMPRAASPHAQRLLPITEIADEINRVATQRAHGRGG